MNIQQLIRAQQTNPALVAVAAKFAAAVSTRKAYLEQETDIEPDTLGAEEAAEHLRQLDADIARYRNEMLALLTD